jgi:colanic acid biosynthesis glycosyl transferase WcaI
LHILLFNEYYPPDTSATAKMAAQVVAALAGRHQVTVLAGRPSYDPDERYPFQFLRRDACGPVTVERVGSTTFSRHEMRGRVANYLSYLGLAIPRALELPSDVVLAMTDPPIAGIAGAYIARMTGRPFVYNLRDLYPDMALGGGIVAPGSVTQHWEQMHRSALREAARVIVLGEDMRERILAKGVAPERVVVVRDGASLPPSLAPPDHPTAQEIRCGFPFTLLHAGNLGFYGAWGTLIRAAEMLKDDGVGLVFVGDGANRGKIEQLARNSSQVRFLPFRPFEEVPYVMAAGDLHVITVRRGLEGVVVPSKLYSILAAGRPVLAVAPLSCDAVRIVVEGGCGVAADPDDPASVVRAVRELRNDPARLAAMGQRAREIARKYDKVGELRRFVQTVEDAADSRFRTG